MVQSSRLVTDGRGQREQLGMIRGRQRPDEVQAGVGEVREVGGRVLSGVEHHGQLGVVTGVGVVTGQRPVGHQLVDDGDEDCDVGPVDAYWNGNALDRTRTSQLTRLELALAA
jgi:hypothetical protein